MEGDLVWLEKKRRQKGGNPKLQPKFVGPYEVIEVYSNHTYGMERSGQVSLQNECKLKLFKPCSEAAGQALAALEPRRRPNMKGATRKAKPIHYDSEAEEEEYRYKQPRVNKEVILEIPNTEQTEQLLPLMDRQLRALSVPHSSHE